MSHRFLASASGLTIMFATALAPAPVAAQTAPSATRTAAPAAGATPWTLPRTADGRPDLQGVWDFRTITPLERPVELGTKAFFTEEEAAKFEKDENRRQNRDLSDAWKWFPTHLQASCISHHENLGMRWNRAVSEHLDTTDPVGLRPKPSRCWRALHSRGPEDVLRPDPFSSQDDAFGIHLLHRRTGAHFHSQFCKFGGRGGRE